MINFLQSIFAKCSRRFGFESQTIYLHAETVSELETFGCFHMYFDANYFIFSLVALFQPVPPGSREFEDILKILHSSYLDLSSVSNFKYKRASLVHSELLEKEVSIFVASAS